MKRVHFTLGGKGGVGKSFVCALITQYLGACGGEVTVIDTDPVNATLSGYPAFASERLPLMEHGALDEGKLDQLIKRILAQDNNTQLVIDSSAAAFTALSRRVAKSAHMLAGDDHALFLHTVISGGQVLGDTLTGLGDLIEQMPAEINIVVWLNAFFGDITLHGQAFEDMPFYARHHARLHGLVRLDRHAGSLYGQDVQRMLAHRLTFAEVAHSGKFDMMAKSRIAQVRAAVYEQLALIL